MRETNEKVLAAEDSEFCSEKFRIIRSYMYSLGFCKLNIESFKLPLSEKYITQIYFVSTVPGIQTNAAIGIISEIGVDMSVFSTSKHLCSWASLMSQYNKSVGKKKNTHIGRADDYIKPLLVKCIFATIKSRKNIEIRNRYLSIKSAEVTRKLPSLSQQCC